jgi:assimilatory nitrate reductase catalytic subunit
MSRTGTLGRLFGHVPEPHIQLHPGDMARRGLKEGDLVHVTSRRGSIVVPLQGSEEVSSGQAFMAMHWGAEVLSGHSTTGEVLSGVNALTLSTFCPQSKQPELKHSAVKVLRAELPWKLIGLAWLPADQAMTRLQELRQLMKHFPFASCVPFSNSAGLQNDPAPATEGIQIRAAAYEAAPPQLLQRIEELLGLNHPQTLRYVDIKRGQHRAALLRREAQQSTLQGLLLAGDTQAEAWLRNLLQQQQPAQSFGLKLLAPGAKPPVGLTPSSSLVCTCVGVNERAIEEKLALRPSPQDEALTHLQSTLRCGTQCGSCVPQLKRMIARLNLNTMSA